MFVGFVIVFIAWELLFPSVRHTRTSGMWPFELKATYIFFGSIIILSNILSRNSRRVRRYCISVQIVLVIAYIYLRQDLFPIRSGILASQYVLMILSVFPIESDLFPWVEKMHKKNGGT
jgi:hypothetical protein